MKKLILGLSVVMVATLSHAAYLYWQIEASSETGIESNGNGYTFNGHDIYGFNVYAVNDTNSSETHLLTTSYYTGSGYSTDTSSSGSPTAISYTSVDNAFSNAYANLESYTEGYSYYVEIVGYDAGAYNGNEGVGVIGSTATPLSYADAVTNGNVLNSNKLTNISQAALEAWNGGAQAAPEPTSGLLLLVGGALLALRRRRA